MGTTLDNGIYLPDEGERNCYEGLAGNWVALDNHLGSTNIHVTINDKQAWNGHVADTTIHVTSADKQTWNSHVADTTIHVTSTDKQAWDGHVADSVKHVTAEDKAKWDAVTGKANDADVVHKRGNETIGGQKTFSHGQTGVGRDVYHFAINPYGKDTPPEITSYQYVWFSGNSASQGFTNNWYGGYIEHVMNTDGSARGRWLIRDTSESSVALEIFVNGSEKQVRPQINNVVELGTSTNKWRSFNGINPGALSMPGYSSRIDISSYVTNLSGTYNAYTPSVDGWIAIQSSDATFIRIADTGSDGLGNTVTSQTAGILTCMIPVRAKRQSNIYIVCTNLTSAYFIPCQGNV